MRSSGSFRPWFRRWRGAGLALVGVPLLVLAVLLARRAGFFLVINHPRHSDVLVVLAGDQDDIRYHRGLELLRAGYARTMVYDVPNDTVAYGWTDVELAQRFVDKSAGGLRARVLICPINAQSTAGEVVNVAACLGQARGPIHRALVVTSDYHTRRALDIFRARLPQYQWSVAAAYDRDSFARHWWMHRQWAKFCVGEWERYLWWQLIDRWRDGPIARAPVA